MKIIFTLAGKSERFTSQGLPIKQLINIDGKTILDHVLDIFEGCKHEDFIFIVKNSDIEKFDIKNFILNKCPKSKVYGIQENSLGPVYSISNIINEIPDSEEIIVSYTDSAQKWDFQNFLKFCRNTKSDGCIVSHENFHPHKLYNKSFAFLKTKGIDVLYVQEKKPFSEVSDEEPASNGIYFFKTGKLLKNYFLKLLNKNITVNGEFYVTLPYNLMIEDRLKVTHYNQTQYICLGTPEDVECFKAWNTILNTNKISPNNVANAFDFWSKFFKKI